MDTQKIDIATLQYHPGRFEKLMNQGFSSEIWNYLTTRGNIQLLIEATNSNKPAIFNILSEIETNFEAALGSEEFEEVPVLVNNMIKQIMEHLGYQHVGCAFCVDAKYIKTTGMYTML